MDLFAISARVAAGEQTGVVEKTPGKGYCVKSEKNPDWSGGCYPTKGEAKERLKEVERAKHAKASTGLSAAEAEFVMSYCDMILSADVPTAFRLEILHDLLASYNSGSE